MDLWFVSDDLYFCARRQLSNEVGGRLENPRMRQILQWLDKLVSRQHVAEGQWFFESSLNDGLKEATSSGKVGIVSVGIVAVGDVFESNQALTFKEL